MVAAKAQGIDLVGRRRLRWLIGCGAKAQEHTETRTIRQQSRGLESP